MARRASILSGLAALIALVVPLQAPASGGCYRVEPEAPGSASSCVVDGAGRYGVVAATQWELRVYAGATCTGRAEDIDTALTRTGRTPSAGLLDFGAAPRCVELRLPAAPGFMAVDAEQYP